jgi:hypothetical protein
VCGSEPTAFIKLKPTNMSKYPKMSRGVFTTYVCEHHETVYERLSTQGANIDDLFDETVNYISPNSTDGILDLSQLFDPRFAEEGEWE